MSFEVPKRWKRFFRSNAEMIADILLVIQNYPHEVYPSKDPKDIFEMFYLMSPKDIRVVIVGQNPYPDRNARGIPFITTRGHMTKSLESMRNEICREYPYLNVPDNINRLVRSWTNQGVFMVNMSLTVGVGPDQFTSDHSIVWEEFVRELISYIIKRHPVPVLLMGQLAWTLEVPKLAIKVPHPTSRDGAFNGCRVFSKCNDHLESDPILWAVEVGDLSF